MTTTTVVDPGINLDELVANRIVEVLNRALRADPVAVRALFQYRVFCNEELAGDPTIQVLSDEAGTTLGVLGLLNGIGGIHGPEAGSKAGWGLLAGLYDVVCPAGHISDQEMAGEPCSTCGANLRLGDLTEFTRIQVDPAG